MRVFKRSGWAISIMLVGLLFIGIGVWRGEAEVVFRNAINICMECIGLG